MCMYEMIIGRKCVDKREWIDEIVNKNYTFV